MPRTNRILLFVGVAVYAVLFISVGLYVFIENDESQPINEILQWDYLIPVTIYSLFSLWVGFGLFLLLNKLFSHFFPKKMFAKIISFPLSLMIGIPVGGFGLGQNASIAYCMICLNIIGGPRARLGASEQDVHLYTQMGFWKNRKGLLRIASERGYVRLRTINSRKCFPSSTQGVNISNSKAPISSYYQLAHEGEKV